IMEFARALLPEAPRGELVERHGEAVETLVFPDEAALVQRVAADAEAYLARGYRSVAVVARTKQEAGELCRALRNKIKIGEILEGDEEFASGAVVIPAYLAKGLEFDVVLLCDAPAGGFRREQERALYYTACTRALHVLRVYRAGETPP
ncbi:MAG TPA: ATP-binding domain-containing protein, partial [Clostridia bacterium]|nr:ATP-binding domain-containing protein [Clostridia bacterium]